MLIVTISALFIKRIITMHNRGLNQPSDNEQKSEIEQQVIPIIQPSRERLPLPPKQRQPQVHSFFGINAKVSVRQRLSYDEQTFLYAVLNNASRYQVPEKIIYALNTMLDAKTGFLIENAKKVENLSDLVFSTINGLETKGEELLDKLFTESESEESSLDEDIISNLAFEAQSTFTKLKNKKATVDNFKTAYQNLSSQVDNLKKMVFKEKIKNAHKNKMSNR